jgi:hypothetical protein
LGAAAAAGAAELASAMSTTAAAKIALVVERTDLSSP